MNIVLICLGNFQEYIVTNLIQLIKTEHYNIHIVASKCILDHFEPFKDTMTIACADDLDDPFDFANKSQLDKEFRSGFWHYTSARMFVLHAYMKKKNLTWVVHLENDVLVYHNCTKILNYANKRAIYMPFDTYQRNIASIMLVPDADILGKVLELYDFTKNDMQNFANKRGLVENLPICVSQPGMSDEQLWVSTKSHDDFIFDAAAMGQLVGGVDPRNIGGDTRGFVNETCVIKYNDYGTIVWIDKKPYYRLHNGNTVPIFNLHIHSKNLQLYTIY